MKKLLYCLISLLIALSLFGCNTNKQIVEPQSET